MLCSPYLKSPGLFPGFLFSINKFGKFKLIVYICLSLNQQTMSETSPENQENIFEEKKYTPEQLKQMRENMKQSYREQIDILDLQLKFEKLNADIAENQARAMMNVLRMAQMKMGPKEPPKSETNNPPE